MKHISLLLTALFVAALSLSATCFYPLYPACGQITTLCPDGTKTGQPPSAQSATCSSTSIKHLNTSNATPYDGSLYTVSSSGTCIYTLCWYTADGHPSSPRIYCSNTDTINPMVPWAGSKPGEPSSQCIGTGTGGM